VEESGGPKIPFRLGRTDADSGETSPKVCRLPDAGKSAFVLFCHVNSWFQYDLYLIILQLGCTNICYIITFIFSNNGNAHLPDKGSRKNTIQHVRDVFYGELYPSFYEYYIEIKSILTL